MKDFLAAARAAARSRLSASQEALEAIALREAGDSGAASLAVGKQVAHTVTVSRKKMAGDVSDDSAEAAKSSCESEGEEEEEEEVTHSAAEGWVDACLAEAEHRVERFERLLKEDPSLKLAPTPAADLRPPETQSEAVEAGDSELVARLSRCLAACVADEGRGFCEQQVVLEGMLVVPKQLLGR